ncbi:hypothetical protein Hdeb2414_s0006g00218331 [Helianthus debilis subsp. tardiflorus]
MVSGGHVSDRRSLSWTGGPCLGPVVLASVRQVSSLVNGSTRVRRVNPGSDESTQRSQDFGFSSELQVDFGSELVQRVPVVGLGSDRVRFGRISQLLKRFGLTRSTQRVHSVNSASQLVKCGQQLRSDGSVRSDN